MAPGVRCQTISSRFAIVVPQHATESLAARYSTSCASYFIAPVDQSVVKRLVIALCVAVRQKSDNGGMQRPLPEKYHALQALLLDRSHETFDIRIQIGRSRGQAHGELKAKFPAGNLPLNMSAHAHASY